LNLPDQAPAYSIGKCKSGGDGPAKDKGKHLHAQFGKCESGGVRLSPYREKLTGTKINQTEYIRRLTRRYK